MKTNSLTVPKATLTLEEQVELGRRMTLYGDKKARDDLILCCVSVVTATAKRFSNHSLASYDDLFQEGMMGVMEAIGKYDYTRNVKFSSFAYSRIIHKLVLWVKNQLKYDQSDVGPNSANGIIVNSTIETFHSVFHTYPTDQQLANLLSMSVENVARLKKKCSDPVPPAFRVCSYDPNAAATSNSDDASSIVIETMCAEYNRKHLMAALDTMDDLEREIILRRHLYSDKKATLEELAQEFNVHAATVSRKEHRALHLILRYFKENDIHPEL